METVRRGLIERPDHQLIQFRGGDVKKLYWSIGEVAEMLSVVPSKIRFWLDEFDLDVRRNKKGNRQFVSSDIEKVKRIYQLVKVERYTLEGAKRQLKLRVEVGVNG